MKEELNKLESVISGESKAGQIELDHLASVWVKVRSATIMEMNCKTQVALAPKLNLTEIFHLE